MFKIILICLMNIIIYIFMLLFTLLSKILKINLQNPFPLKMSYAKSFNTHAGEIHFTLSYHVLVKLPCFGFVLLEPFDFSRS